MEITISDSLRDLLLKIRQLKIDELKTLPNTFELYRMWFNIIGRDYPKSQINELESLLLKVCKLECGGDFVSIQLMQDVGTIYIKRKSGTTVFANETSEFINGRC